MLDWKKCHRVQGHLLYLGFLGGKKQTPTQGALCHGGHMGRNQRNKACQPLERQGLKGSSSPKSKMHGLPISMSFTILKDLLGLLFQPPRKYFVPLFSYLLFGFAALKHQLACGLVWLEGLPHPPMHLPSIHPCMHPSTYPAIHPCMHACVHLSIHPCIHPYIHVCIHPSKNIYQSPALHQTP